MKALALVLLCSCAPAVVSAPASMPQLHIDPKLEGAVLSRQAAEVVVTKRLQDAAACDARVADCGTQNAILRDELARALIRAARISWWEQYGLLLSIGVAVVFGAAGVTVGFELGKK